MTSGLGHPKPRVAIRLDPLLHRLIAPIVAGLSLLAFVVLSIGAASLGAHPASHESAGPHPQGPGTPHGAGRVATQGHAEAPARSR